MFGENAVRRSAAPISSAMEWYRFLKISSSTGSRRALLRMRRSVNRSLAVCRWSLANLCGFQLWILGLANDRRLSANDGPQDFRVKLQNSVDTLFILPQYLVI